MPDLAVTAALLVLVVVVEASPYLRIPLGLLLAIGMLTSDAALWSVVVIGAAGVTIGRLALALQARLAGSNRTRSAASKQASDALRAKLSSSPAYARTTFWIAAMPGVPASFVFPLLGAMRAPLLPALAGTLVGRIPILTITTSLFVWLGTLGNTTNEQAATTLAVFAALWLLFRTLNLIDWQHRAETGTWRMRDPNAGATRVTTMFGGPMGDGFSASTTRPGYEDERSVASESEEDVIEGELLGEEIDGDDDGDAPSSSSESPRS